jgi:ABC-type Fe3+ transport system permease subunit
VKITDIVAVALVSVCTFGPMFALAVYGFKRGKRTFTDQLARLGSPLQARWKSMATSLRFAIIPALSTLFGGIRIRVMRHNDVDAETVWACIVAIAVLLIVCVIIPFMVGIQRGYRIATKEG